MLTRTRTVALAAHCLLRDATYDVEQGDEHRQGLAPQEISSEDVADIGRLFLDKKFTHGSPALYMRAPEKDDAMGKWGYLYGLGLVPQGLNPALAQGPLRLKVLTYRFTPDLPLRFAAVHKEGQDEIRKNARACQGDSGGPLMVPMKDGRLALAGLMTATLPIGQGPPTCVTPTSEYSTVVSWTGGFLSLLLGPNP